MVFSVISVFDVIMFAIAVGYGFFVTMKKKSSADPALEQWIQWIQWTCNKKLDKFSKTYATLSIL